MNIEERNRIIALIEDIEKLNITKEVAKYFKGSSEINTVAIGKYPVKEFIHFFNRAISQLKTELLTDNFYFYPLQPKAQPILGVNIETTLNQIKTLISQQNFSKVAAYLDILITYEFYFGIWHISSHSIHNPEELQLNKKKEEVDLLYSSLEIAINNLNSKIHEVENVKGMVNDFIVQKNNELLSITNSLKQAIEDKKNISEILKKVQSVENEINAILPIQQQNLKEIKILQSEVENYQIDYTKRMKEYESKMIEYFDDTEKNNLKTSELIAFVEGKKDEIMKLTGYAADGALGNKFNERQTLLKKGLKSWKWLVPGVTVLSIIWVVVVFTCLSAKMDPYWLGLAINIFKTFPVFILMGFVFKQYNKERNLQEEYAFKASVAMTITAYSELLKGQDSSNNSSRQAMLLNAIKEVYNSTKLQNEVKQRMVSFNNKELKEAILHLTTLINEAKNMGK